MAVIVSKGIVVPERITYVKWLQSSGTQYFDTGVLPTQNTGLEIVVSDWDTSETSTTLYGTQSSSSDRYDLFVTAGGAYRTYFGGSYVGFASGASAANKVTIIREGTTISIGDVSATNTEKTFACTTSLYLLGHNTSGAVSKQASLKLYSCKIYDGDTLVRDYWPCYDPDGVACLYDKVNEEYIYNAGTGEFIAGEAA